MNTTTTRSNPIYFVAMALITPILLAACSSAPESGTEGPRVDSAAKEHPLKTAHSVPTTDMDRVRAEMGNPDDLVQSSDGGETWIYFGSMGTKEIAFDPSGHRLASVPVRRAKTSMSASARKHIPSIMPRSRTFDGVRTTFGIPSRVVKEPSGMHTEWIYEYGVGTKNFAFDESGRLLTITDHRSDRPWVPSFFSSTKADFLKHWGKPVQVTLWFYDRGIVEIWEYDSPKGWMQTFDNETPDNMGFRVIRNQFFSASKGKSRAPRKVVAKAPFDMSVWGLYFKLDKEALSIFRSVYYK